MKHGHGILKQLCFALCGALITSQSPQIATQAATLDFGLPVSSFHYGGTGAGVVPGGTDAFGTNPVELFAQDYGFLRTSGSTAISAIGVTSGVYDQVSLQYSYILSVPQVVNISIFLNNASTGDQLLLDLLDQDTGGFQVTTTADVQAVTDFFNTELQSGSAPEFTLQFALVGAPSGFGFNNVQLSFVPSTPVPEPSPVFGLLGLGSMGIIAIARRRHTKNG